MPRPEMPRPECQDQNAKTRMPRPEGNTYLPNIMTFNAVFTQNNL